MPVICVPLMRTNLQAGSDKKSVVILAGARLCEVERQLVHVRASHSVVFGCNLHGVLVTEVKTLRNDLRFTALVRHRSDDDTCANEWRAEANVIIGVGGDNYAPAAAHANSDHMRVNDVAAWSF